MVWFRYAPEILERYPNVHGGVILANGVSGGPTPPRLLEAYRAEQRAALDRLGETPLAGVESLGAWRQAFSAFGVKPTQYRSAAEALLRRLTKKGDIPSLNLLVDLGNLVSIRYALPVAVIDLRDVVAPITVRLARGDEPFTELGAQEARSPEPGEVVFLDGNGRVHARRWCWRQSAQSAARESTTDILVTVESHHGGGADDVRAAVDDLGALLDRFAGGTRRATVLSATEPEFEAD